jgi:hypothetical protein
MGRFFVGVQVAFAFCLVMAGATCLFSLRNLFAVNPGFDSHGVAVLSLSNDSKSLALMEQLQNRVKTLPGVQQAAVAGWAILSGSYWVQQVFLPGKAPSERSEPFYHVSPGYFKAFHTPLLSGRDYTAQDLHNTKMVPTIINQAFAQRYFGRADPLGKTFQKHQVIGVAAHAQYDELRHEPPPMVYVPIEGSKVRMVAGDEGGGSGDAGWGGYDT